MTPVPKHLATPGVVLEIVGDEDGVPLVHPGGVRAVLEDEHIGHVAPQPSQVLRVPVPRATQGSGSVCLPSAKPTAHVW